MSHPGNDIVIDQVSDQVADMSLQQVVKELISRKIVLHYSEKPRDILMDLIYEERMSQEWVQY